MTRASGAPGRPCAIADALAVVGGRWSLLIIREIALGNRRFGQIARNTGAPRDRLASRLKDLVASGVIERRECQTEPRYFEYGLTPAGNDLLAVLHVLRDWGERWVVGYAPMEFEHDQHIFNPMVVCEQCGDQVGDNDVRLRSTVGGWDVGGPLPAGRTKPSRVADVRTVVREPRSDDQPR